MIANLISLSRLLLAAAFVHYATRPVIAVAILCAAGVSDWLDGWVAKRTGRPTRFGAILDPICDRLFLVPVLATLVIVHGLPLWQLAVLIARDVFNTIGAAVLWLFRPDGFRSLRPLRAGKVVTSLQFWCVVHIVLRLPWFELTFAAVAAANAWALVDYTRQFGHLLWSSTPPRRDGEGAASGAFEGLSASSSCRPRSHS
jgi:CDP-diacylglycerol--glycerol-3-phosphate 3-phosphatidyltransferase/cardiolipin synthase